MKYKKLWWCDDNDGNGKHGDKDNVPLLPPFSSMHGCHSATKPKSPTLTAPSGANSILEGYRKIL